MGRLLIVGPAARRGILAEAKREGIDLASITREVDGKQVLDWEELIEAIDKKKSEAGR